MLFVLFVLFVVNVFKRLTRITRIARINTNKDIYFNTTDANSGTVTIENSVVINTTRDANVGFES